MIDWIKTAQGVAAISAAIFATMVAWWNLGLPRRVFSPELARIHVRSAALKQFNRDTRLLVPDPAWWRANPLGMLWPEMDVAFVRSGDPSTSIRGEVLAPLLPLYVFCGRHLLGYAIRRWDHRALGVPTVPHGGPDKVVPAWRA